uniref:Odorant receptor n=1 Tax=Aphidius gifuensis TaxID=684658 RepID=A0A3Q9ELK4_APHGI|nr:odorant receptor [Aphidius gifuensis]
MTSHEYKPINAFKINLNIFTAEGIWPAGLKNKNLRYPYAVYRLLSPSIWFGLFFIFQLIQVIIVINDMAKLMDSMYLMVTYFAILSKFMCFILYRKRIEKLFNTLDESIFIPRQKKHFDYINEAMRIIRRDTIFFLSSGISATIFWTFYPLFDKHQEEKQLAYVMWCPIDVSTSPIFELVYTYQVIAITYNTMFNTMADTTICGLFRMMSGHLEILAQDYSELFDDNFISPGDIVDKKNNINKGLSNYNTEKLSKYKNDNEDIDEDKYLIVKKPNVTHEKLSYRVAACVEYAQAIEKFVNEVNDVFQGGILTQFIASCLIICATAFALTMVPVASVQFVSLLQYQGCMIIQIFIYCWRGNELTLKFSELSNAIFKCNWQLCNGHFRRSMDIIMSRSQKPMILVVAGLFSLSVDTFIGIIKSAYSFFMFLKEVQTAAAED